MAEVVRQSVASDGFLPFEYGDLRLPELTPEETAIREFQPDGTRFAEFINTPEIKALFEGVEDKRGSQIFKLMDKVVARFVETEIDTLPISPELRARAKNVVTKRDWKGVSTHSGEKLVLFELVSKTNRFKYGLIQHWLNTTGETGLTEVGALEYGSLMPAMAATDRMFIKMAMETFPISSDERIKKGLTNECAVVKETAGGVVEVPFHEAYPEETGIIVEGYELLIGKLRTLETQAKARNQTDLLDLIARKIAYYEAILEATKTSDPEKWKEADTLLPGQIRSGDDVIQIHPSETAYMEDRVLRAPQLSLRAPDLDEREAISLAEDTKTKMVQSLVSTFDRKRAVAGSLDLVRKSNVAPRHFLEAGFGLDLLPVGQVLPNEFEAKARGGVDASLSVDSMKGRLAGMSQILRKIFGDGVFERECAPVCNPDNASRIVGEHVTSHELGHAVGISPDLPQHLGQSYLEYIEEWKASAAGMVCGLYVPFTQLEVDLRELMNDVIYQIATACRYANIRNNPFAHGYFRQSVMFMKVAEEVGILQEDQSNPEFPWKINVNGENARAFYERITSQFGETMDLYADGNEEGLYNFLERELVPSRFMEFACGRLQVEKPEENSKSNLIKSPRQLRREKEAAAKLVDAVAEEAGITREEVMGVVVAIVPQDDGTKGAIVEGGGEEETAATVEAVIEEK